MRELHGDLTDALGCYQQVLALQADHLEALQASADLLLRLDRFDEALDVLTVLRAGPSRTVAVSARAGELFTRQRRYEAALGAWAEVLSERPRDLQALLGRARGLAALGREAEALEAWAVVLQVNDVTSETLSDASRWTLDALPRAQLEARVERARLTAKVDAEAARAAFEAIFAADLRELTSVVSPVNVPALLEDSAVAREALARVEARQPEVANAWRFTAGLWAEAGVPERALASARKALAIAERSPQNDEKHSMATDQATCGSALLALGRPREALIAFELSLTLWPEYVPAKQGRAQARSMLDR
ncbi:MAG: tetratricopeptide repeat protein [Myxococcaceae bacterium]